MNNLVKNLRHTNKLDVYESIVQEERTNGVIEKVEVDKVNETVSERVFHMLHRPVIGESTKKTKIRIVYDAPAKACQTSTSLNECLETGPPLQNQQWDKLIRSRFRPILCCGDIEKVFLQTRITVSKRNAVRFHWVSNIDLNSIELNRFLRLVFGLTKSHFILEGTSKLQI